MVHLWKDIFSTHPMCISANTNKKTSLRSQHGASNIMPHTAKFSSNDVSPVWNVAHYTKQKESRWQHMFCFPGLCLWLSVCELGYVQRKFTFTRTLSSQSPRHPMWPEILSSACWPVGISYVMTVKIVHSKQQKVFFFFFPFPHPIGYSP